MKFSPVHHFGIKKLKGCPVLVQALTERWIYSQRAVPELQWSVLHHELCELGSPATSGWMHIWVTAAEQELSHPTAQTNADCTGGKHTKVTSDIDLNIDQIRHWWQLWKRFWLLKSDPQIRVETPPLLQVIRDTHPSQPTSQTDSCFSNRAPVPGRELHALLFGMSLTPELWWHCSSRAALEHDLSSHRALPPCKPARVLMLASMAAALAFLSGRNPSSSEGSCLWGVRSLVHTSLTLLGHRKHWRLWNQRFCILRSEHSHYVWEHSMKQEAKSRSIRLTENKWLEITTLGVSTLIFGW